jgi:hypothetical protein
MPMTIDEREAMNATLLWINLRTGLLPVGAVAYPLSKGYSNVNTLPRAEGRFMPASNTKMLVRDKLLGHLRPRKPRLSIVHLFQHLRLVRSGEKDSAVGHPRFSSGHALEQED